jgi:hypothetical protein
MNEGRMGGVEMKNKPAVCFDEKRLTAGFAHCAGSRRLSSSGSRAVSQQEGSLLRI